MRFPLIRGRAGSGSRAQAGLSESRTLALREELESLAPDEHPFDLDHLPRNRESHCGTRGGPFQKMPLGDGMEERSIMLGLIVIILATVVILGAYFVF